MLIALLFRLGNPAHGYRRYYMRIKSVEYKMLIILLLIKKLQMTICFYALTAVDVDIVSGSVTALYRKFNYD